MSVESEALSLLRSCCYLNRDKLAKLLEASSQEAGAVKASVESEASALRQALSEVEARLAEAVARERRLEEQGVAREAQHREQLAAVKAEAQRAMQAAAKVCLGHTSHVTYVACNL